MSCAKVTVVCVATALSLSLSACGVAAKPEAGSARATAASQQQLTNSDPRTKHVKCLAQHHLEYSLLTIGADPSIQVGARPSGPTIEFTATPGAAQNAAITGQAQGAEVIGSALVYPWQAPDKLMATVEACMRLGVTG